MTPECLGAMQASPPSGALPGVQPEAPAQRAAPNRRLAQRTRSRRRHRQCAFLALAWQARRGQPTAGCPQRRGAAPTEDAARTDRTDQRERARGVSLSAFERGLPGRTCLAFLYLYLAKAYKKEVLLCKPNVLVGKSDRTNSKSASLSLLKLEAPEHDFDTFSTWPTRKRYLHAQPSHARGLVRL